MSRLTNDNMIDRLREQHQALRRIGEEFLALVADETPCDQDALADCRWRLTRGLLQHLALEERCVYRPLERDPRAAVSAPALEFREQLDQTYAAMNAYLDTWTPDRIVAHWDEFVRVSRHAMRGFFERMEREEAELYPMVNGQTDIGIRTPDDRNWAADASRFRERIEGRSPLSQPWMQVR